MPYWTFNTLKIYGSYDELNRFIDENKSDDDKNHLSLQKSVPLIHSLKSKTDYETEIEEQSSEDELQPEAVKEAMELWGTKWDIKVYKFKKYEDYIKYKFCTPNNPPKTWISSVAMKYPLLHFHLKAMEIDDKDELIEGEWYDGCELKYNICSYSKHMYDRDGANRIVLKIIDLLKEDTKLVNDLLHTSKKFMEWLEDTNDIKESILVVLDEEECYDYIQYLFERIKYYLLYNSFQ